jgi:predicted phosphodiesterase
MAILFYGDPHGHWEPLFDAVATRRPEHVVLLGDMELDLPLEAAAAPLVALGIPLWWVRGNHDADTVARHDFLHLDGHPGGDLGGRVAVLGCALGSLRVAGLGGVFKGRVWYPRVGDEAPRHASRDAFLQQHGRGGRFRGGVPFCHVDTIFPDDVAGLSANSADVLVCHEAPTSIPGDMGFRAIDELASDLGAALVVHGHHHRSYQGETRDGVVVRGLGLAEPWYLEVPIRPPEGA